MRSMRNPRIARLVQRSLGGRRAGQPHENFRRDGNDYQGVSGDWIEPLPDRLCENVTGARRSCHVDAQFVTDIRKDLSVIAIPRENSLDHREPSPRSQPTVPSNRSPKLDGRSCAWAKLLAGKEHVQHELRSLRHFYQGASGLHLA